MKITNFAISLAAITLAYTVPCFAGADGSGGGIGVYINGKIKLLDLTEAWPLKIKEIPEYAALKQSLMEMRNYNQYFASAVTSAIDDETIYFYLTSYEIAPTNDSRTMLLVDGEVNVAAQRGKVVVINEGYWQGADAEERIGTILHETVENLHPTQDRMMLRRVVDRMVRRAFGESDERFTGFLNAMGMRYFAGDTPNCKAASDAIDNRVNAYVTSFKSWAMTRNVSIRDCTRSAEELGSKLSAELYSKFPPSYCYGALRILYFHDVPLANAQMEMHTQCVAKALR